MQDTLQLEVTTCLAEDGFFLDELVIKTRELFETEGDGGADRISSSADGMKLICRRLVSGEKLMAFKPCCEHPRYGYKDFLDRTFRTSAGTGQDFMASSLL